MRERPESKFLFGKAPQLRQTMWFCDQENDDQCANDDQLQMGHDVMVAIKAELVACPDPNSVPERINSVEKLFRQRFEQVTWLFFEPDIED